MNRIRLLSLWFLCVDLHSPSGGKSELRTNSAPICHLDTLRYIEICAKKVRKIIGIGVNVEIY